MTAIPAAIRHVRTAALVALSFRVSSRIGGAGADAGYAPVHPVSGPAGRLPL